MTLRNGEQALEASINGARFALDRLGLLLLASNSVLAVRKQLRVSSGASYMPGSVELKRVELHRKLMSAQDSLETGGLVQIVRT